MTEQQIQEKVNQIEAIYYDFQRRLYRLKSEQDAIVSNFLKSLEATKLEEIRKTLSNS